MTDITNPFASWVKFGLSPEQSEWRIIMKIALGADSAGKPLLDVIEAHLKARGDHQVTNMSESGFYADLSGKVAQAVKKGEHDRAILVCGTGIGVCISANKVPGIRAALTHDTYSAPPTTRKSSPWVRVSSVPNWPKPLLIRG
jgi:Ribose/Galactose Isomerase